MKRSHTGATVAKASDKAQLVQIIDGSLAESLCKTTANEMCNVSSGTFAKVDILEIKDDLKEHADFIEEMRAVCVSCKEEMLKSTYPTWLS